MNRKDNKEEKRERERDEKEERRERGREAHLQHSNVVEHKDGHIRLGQRRAPRFTRLEQRLNHPAQHFVHKAGVFRVGVGRLRR